MTQIVVTKRQDRVVRDCCKGVPAARRAECESEARKTFAFAGAALADALDGLGQTMLNAIRRSNRA